MPSGFKTFAEEEFDRVFIKDSEIIDNFVGNRLWVWGSGAFGGLGDGTSSDRLSPVTTSGGGVNWKQVSASDYHSAAVKTDGTLWTWGWNNFGALGTNDTSNRSSPGTMAGGGTDWKQVSCSHSGRQTAAIKTDGTLWTCGYNTQGQLGTNNTTARSSPGTTSGGGTNWKQVSSGQGSTYAVKTDGTLWTWGKDAYGQLGKGGANASRSSPGTTANGGTNWKQVAAGFGTAHAIKTDGTLWGCGYNSFGQVGDNSTTDRSSFVSVSGGGTNWKQVSTGYRLSMAVKTDGTLWGWGRNFDGSIGDGTVTQRNSPVTTAGGGTNWKTVASQSNENNSGGVAIKTDGTIWTWGRATALGLNLSGLDANRRSSPGTILGNSSNWKQISVNSQNVMAIGD